MDSLSITEIGSEALIVAVMVASPMLLVALIVGLVIGVVQAATSINEMTLSSDLGRFRCSLILRAVSLNAFLHFLCKRILWSFSSQIWLNGFMLQCGHF